MNVSAQYLRPFGIAIKYGPRIMWLGRYGCGIYVQHPRPGVPYIYHSIGHPGVVRYSGEDWRLGYQIQKR